MMLDRAARLQAWNALSTFWTAHQNGTATFSAFALGFRVAVTSLEEGGDELAERLRPLLEQVEGVDRRASSDAPLSPDDLALATEAVHEAELLLRG